MRKAGSAVILLISDVGNYSGEFGAVEDYHFP